MTIEPLPTRQQAQASRREAVGTDRFMYGQRLLEAYIEGYLIDGQAIRDVLPDLIELAQDGIAYTPEYFRDKWEMSARMNVILANPIVEELLGLDTPAEKSYEAIEIATLAEFINERRRAHQKHGDNSQEGNDWDSVKSLTILVEEVGEVAKVFNERDLGNITDVQAQQELRKELIQTGAMCLVWIINIEAVAEESDEGKLIRWCFEHEERPVTSLGGHEMSCPKGRSFPPFDQTSCRIDFLSTEENNDMVRQIAEDVVLGTPLPEEDSNDR